MQAITRHSNTEKGVKVRLLPHLVPRGGLIGFLPQDLQLQRLGQARRGLGRSGNGWRERREAKEQGGSQRKKSEMSEKLGNRALFIGKKLDHCKCIERVPSCSVIPSQTMESQKNRAHDPQNRNACKFKSTLGCDGTTSEWRAI